MTQHQSETGLRVLYFVPCLSFAALLFVNSYSHTSADVTMLVNVMRKWLIGFYYAKFRFDASF